MSEILDLLPLTIPLAAVVVLVLAWRRPEWIFVTDPDDGERAPRCRFWRSHQWERPVTTDGERRQSCARCPVTRRVEWVTPPVGRPAREMLDGTTAAVLAGAEADEALRAYRLRRVSERAFDRVQRARKAGVA